MSASRMKNLIILVLTLCALGLLCIAVPSRLSQTHEQRQMLQELKTLYDSYGLSIDLGELPRSPVLYSVELSEDGAQTAAQAPTMLIVDPICDGMRVPASLIR